MIRVSNLYFYLSRKTNPNLCVVCRYLAQLQYYRADSTLKPSTSITEANEETKRRAAMVTSKSVGNRGNRRSSVFERVSKGVFEDLRADERSSPLEN